MIGFLYKGNNEIAKLFDKRLSKTFGYEINHNDLVTNCRSMHHSTGSPFETNPLGTQAVYRYLCIDSNKMLFSHNIMNNGSIIPQKNPDINFYITVNVKSPKTLELVKDVQSIQEIWHDFGLCPDTEPMPESTNLAFDLFDSRVSYNELNDEIKLLSGNENFSVERNPWGGGLQCFYKKSPCSVEDLFSIFSPKTTQSRFLSF